MTTSPKIACFVSPHGFGHAARASAVMAALQRRYPALRFEIFTTVPRWFFAESLARPFGYHTQLTDIGLVQKNSLEEDLPETVHRLNQFLPFELEFIDALARQIQWLGCRLVICDIAPMGIAAAKKAGLPEVLIENFTWDWIYEGYTAYSRPLTPHINYLQEIFSLADYHIQTEPVCCPEPVDLRTAPVSRTIRDSRARVRQQLGIPDEAKMVVLTMGGIDWDYTFLRRLEPLNGIYIVTAGHTPQVESRGPVIFLSRSSTFFHPDLVNAADALIGKLGYSTLAEVYRAGVPYGYLEWPQFRESAVMADYVQTKMRGLPIETAHFQNGNWLSKLPELLALPRLERNEINGAAQIAEFIRV